MKMGNRGKPAVTRRVFLTTAATFIGTIPILGLIGRSLLPLRRNSYQQAAARHDLCSDPISVYKMVPLPGIKYDKAEMRHMANKIFPSVAAARARRPHRGFLYGLKPIALPRSLTNGMDQCALFCNRKDFDQRVRADRRHWQRLGVDVDTVFSVVRNA
jgi:hypothetical protein